MSAHPEPILIKCYGNTRLYEPARGRYVSLDMLHAWAALSVLFTVQDATTGEDITRILLA